MRSNSRSRRERPHQFFKVVLPSNAKNKKLKIPPKFVSIFGDELADVATLTTPTGHVWNVGLEKGSDKACWFCDGWREFAEHHSILAGYFLLFTYEGKSKFRVSVFDMTACEIDYPCNPYNGSIRQFHGGKKIPVYAKEEELEDDVSVEFLGSSPPWQTATVSKEEQNHCAGSNPSKPHKKMAESCLKSGLGIKKDDRDDDSLQSPKSKQARSRESKRYKMGKETESEQEEPLMEHNKASKTNARIKRASRRPNPAIPSFSVTVRPYSIESHFLNVPVPFGRKYLRTEFIKLQDSSGRQWPVKCCRQNQWKAVKLTKGWADFVVDNKLKVGDVCLFELAQLKEAVLNVSIYKQ